MKKQMNQKKSKAENRNFIAIADRALGLTIGQLALLVLSVIILMYANGKAKTWPAAWIGPVFLLRFTRTMPVIRGMVYAWAALWLTFFISWYGVLLMVPTAVHALMCIVTALVATVPLLVDRLVSPRLKGALATLIYPCTVTAMEFISSFSPGSGTWVSTAYTQYGILALMQLASVTGIWGITFLVSWFPAVANQVWENKFSMKKTESSVVVFSLTLIAVCIFGISRIAEKPPHKSKTTLAAVTTASDIRARGIPWLTKGISPFDITKSIEQMEASTASAAGRGARIVAWQEYADLISTDDEAVFLGRASELAKKNTIHLILGYGLLSPKKNVKGDNKIVCMGPDGTQLWQYKKHYLAPGSEEPFFNAGTGPIPLTETPFGKMSSVICFDQEFPSYIRSMDDDTTLLTIPSFDWKAITPWHSYMAVYRGIENGCFILRPAGEGLSMISDPYGRIVARDSYFESPDRVMTAEVELFPVKTVYETAGDYFPIACICIVLAMAGVALYRSKAKV